jgi:hypothetical protein
MSRMTVRRLEKGESYVEFRFDGPFASMRTTESVKRVDMSKDDALDRIANLDADHWDEVDAPY